MEFHLPVINSTDGLYQQAVPGKDYITEMVSVLFKPYVQRMSYQLTLLPDNDEGEKEMFRIDSLTSQDDTFPSFLPPTGLCNGTDVFIIDAKGKVYKYTHAYLYC